MRSVFRNSVLVAALHASLCAVAAPATAVADEAGNSSSGAAGPDGRPANSAGADSAGPSSGNRTIDRLLNGPGESGDANATDKPAKKLVEGMLPAKVATGAAAASAASPLAELQAVILGNRDTKGKQTATEQNPELPPERRRETDPVSNAPRTAHSDASGGSAAAENPGFAVKLARYIRDNRLLVIGASLLVLAAVWGAATFASQRRR